MSWKSLVCAGLLCVVASPVFAQPLLTVGAGGTNATSHLNAAGNWVWRIDITPRVGTTPTAGLPVAAELGFRETGTRRPTTGPTAAQLLGTGNGISKNATNFPDDNPGTKIFTWETEIDVDPGAGVNMKPVGLQSRCATGCTSTGAEDEIFAALGSIDFTTAGAQQFLTITVDRPMTNNASDPSTTTLQVLGKYGTGSAMGRIAQILSGLGVNYDVFSHAGITRQARGGDVNLDGDVNIADFSPLNTNYNGATTGQTWLTGDFNGDGDVNIADFSQLNTNYIPLTYTVGAPVSISAPGAGSVVGSVPEPTSIILLVLAGLGVVGLRGRR